MIHTSISSGSQRFKTFNLPHPRNILVFETGSHEQFVSNTYQSFVVHSLSPAFAQSVLPYLEMSIGQFDRTHSSALYEVHQAAAFVAMEEA